MTFPEKLKAARGAAELTQIQLADIVGISSRSIVAYEHGEKQPRPWVIQQLSKALGVSVRYLTDDSCVDPMDGMELDRHLSDTRTRYDLQTAMESLTTVQIMASVLFAEGRLTPQQQDVFLDALRSTYNNLKGISKKSRMKMAG